MPPPFRLGALALALACLSPAARAFEALPAPLPILAANPWAGTPMGAWSGFSSGAQLFAAPGATFARAAGYNQLLSKNLLLGVETSAFTAPAGFGRGSATDFSSTSMRLTWNMGALKPFVTAGMAQAKPNAFGGANFSLPADPLVNTRDAKTFTNIGAGFDFAVSDKLTLGVAVSAGSGQGFRAP